MKVWGFVLPQCLFFESRGILCCHCLSVLNFERVNKVVLRYILEHLRENVKRRQTHIKSSYDEPLLEPRSRKFDDLVFQSKELTMILYRAYDNVMAEIEEYKAKSKGKCFLSHEDALLDEINDLQSPSHIRIRRHFKNRFGSNIEK
ncbi:hypothetical protein AHAS_Ahas04G0127500 [Arachis hypogaea]